MPRAIMNKSAAFVVVVVIAFFAIAIAPHVTSSDNSDNNVLNNNTTIDADNYYIQAGDFRPMNELIVFLDRIEKSESPPNDGQARMLNYCLKNLSMYSYASK